MPLDAIDKKIVTILQKNGRTPIKDIAKVTFLSSPAVSARMHKLEKEGIITNYAARIDLTALGYLIKAFIQVEVEPVQKDTFYPFVESVPNVLECNCITGDYAMLLKVAFENTQALDAFINELQKFGKTRTQIVFSTPVGPRSLVLKEGKGE